MVAVVKHLAIPQLLLNAFLQGFCETSSSTWLIALLIVIAGDGPDKICRVLAAPPRISMVVASMISKILLVGLIPVYFRLGSLVQGCKSERSPVQPNLFRQSASCTCHFVICWSSYGHGLPSAQNAGSRLPSLLLTGRHEFRQLL